MALPGLVLLMCRSVGRFCDTEAPCRVRGCHRAWGMAPQAPVASELSRPWTCLPHRVLACGRLQTHREPAHSCLHSRRGISWLWPRMDGHRDTGRHMAQGHGQQLPVSGLSG